MAYETGTASGPGGLLVKLFDFAAANGWTIDEDVVTGVEDPANGALHKNNVYVSFRWFTNALKLYQARGFTASTTPGSHPNSAYNDSVTSQSTGSLVNAIAGPYTAYHFFEGDNYLHIVINIDGERYRHFGFGEMVKIGDWSGGEYSYAHYWDQGTTDIDNKDTADHRTGFDGNTAGNRIRPSSIMYGKTNSSEVLPGGYTGTKWYIGGETITSGTDPDGDQWGTMITHGVRGGINAHLLSIGVSQLNGFVALCHIAYMIRDYNSSPDRCYLMGHRPDTRGCNMKALSAGVEYTVGSEVWIPFPLTRIGGGNNGTAEASGNLGVAYKRIS